MDWYLLQVRHDSAVAQDLVSSEIRVFCPEYTVEYWHPRKSVVVSRHCRLLPGNLLVGTSCIPVSTTRHWHRFMLDHVSGRPLRVPEADSLIARCEAGEFDVRRAHESWFETGSRVFVSLLNLYGSIIRRARGEYLVLLDAGHTVTVGRGGVSLA